MNQSNAKAIFYRLTRSLRIKLWAIIVAFMVGVHNFYKGDDKTPEDMAVKTELNEAQKDASPKD